MEGEAGGGEAGFSSADVALKSVLGTHIPFEPNVLVLKIKDGGHVACPGAYSPCRGKAGFVLCVKQRF